MVDTREYDEFCPTTDRYPDGPQRAWALAGAICKEAGEVMARFVKPYRDDANIDPDAIISELGDICYGVQRLADWCGVPLEEVLRRNMIKLRSRADRDVIHGSGDDR